MVFSIIIVNYNLSYNVIDSIKSLLSFVKGQEYEMIIVDNDSHQAEKDILKKEINTIPQVKLCFLDSNKGFGAGNNFGFEKANGDILFLLNPDTIITRNIFNQVEKIFNSYSEVSVLGPKIVNEQNVQEKSAGKFPNLLSEFLNIFFISRHIEKKYFNSKEKKTSNGFVEVDWITGSAMFIRRSVFKNTGGFDTNFFMYSEEIDLCKRIKDSGGKIVYYPDVELVHKGSVGSKKNYFFFTKTSYESKYYYIKKHFKGLEKFLIICFLKIQIILQLIIWTMLFSFNPPKSAGKLKAFGKLLFSSRISESNK